MAGNKVKTITQFLDGLRECWPDFDMTLNDLLNPSLNSVIKLYETFIHDFGIKIDTIITLLNQDKEYEDIMYVYIMCTCANRLFQQLEFTTVDSLAFSLINVINPTNDKGLVPRTSLLANFLYYVKVTSAHTTLPLRAKVLDDIDALDNLKKKIDNKNEELKTAAFTQVNNIDKIDKLKNKKKKLKNSLNAWQKESPDLVEKINIINAELQLKEKENDTITENIENSLKNKNKLEPLIVDDNETIMAEQSKIKKELAEEEVQLNEHMKNIELKIEALSGLAKDSEINNNFIESFNLLKVLEIHNLIEEQRNEKEKIIKETHAYQKTENELHNLKDQKNLELKELEEKSLALNLKFDIELQTLNDEIIHLNNEYEENMNKFEKSTDNVAELSKELTYITECCDKYIEKTIKQYKFYETLYASFLDAKTSLDNTAVDVITLIKEKGAVMKSGRNQESK